MSRAISFGTTHTMQGDLIKFSYPLANIRDITLYTWSNTGEGLIISDAELSTSWSAFQHS